MWGKKASPFTEESNTWQHEKTQDALRILEMQIRANTTWKFQKSDGFILMNFCRMGMKGTIPESHNSQLPSPQRPAGPSSSTTATPHTWREKTLPCGAELCVNSQGCTGLALIPVRHEAMGHSTWANRGSSEQPTTRVRDATSQGKNFWLQHPEHADTSLTQEQVWMPVSNRLLNTAPGSHSTPIPFRIWSC